MKTLHSSKKSLSQLPVFVLEEGGVFIAFSPALDLSTSGQTPAEAKKRFSEAMELFFEELKERGSVKEVLESLGWQRKGGQWHPPHLIESEFERMTPPTLVS